MRKTRGRKPNFCCQDCAANTLHLNEYYMVQRPVWEEAAQGQREILEGMLCIGCLEVRLGRVLIPGDFSSVPLNTLPCETRSARLLDRMGKHHENRP